jgi:hypothetical protein
MKTVKKISLLNIKISLVSRHASEDASYFLKVGVGNTVQRSESLKKPTQHAYYEFKCLEV